HGRGVKHSAIGGTIKSMKVMTIDGEIIQVKPGDALFAGVLGGYGGIAIILEVCLITVPNTKLKRVVDEINLSQISTRFLAMDEGLTEQSLVYYNGLIYPKSKDIVHEIRYREVPIQTPLTIKERIQPRK